MLESLAECWRHGNCEIVNFLEINEIVNLLTSHSPKCSMTIRIIITVKV